MYLLVCANVVCVGCAHRIRWEWGMRKSFYGWISPGQQIGINKETYCEYEKKLRPTFQPNRILIEHCKVLYVLFFISPINHSPVNIVWLQNNSVFQKFGRRNIYTLGHYKIKATDILISIWNWETLLDLVRLSEFYFDALCCVALCLHPITKRLHQKAVFAP